jgi:hypothetical protein
VKGERYAIGALAGGADPVHVKTFLEWLKHVPFLDFDEVRTAYARVMANGLDWEKQLLGCNDRYFLLTVLLGRPDALHPWLYARCREVEAAPDDHMDLWARDHYKSTIITFAGVIQEILADPDITIGLFSFNQKIAGAFVKQVKREFEHNTRLKELYSDALWTDPTKEAPLWTDQGFIVRRGSNPKEGTLEGWGLVNGQPTSKHYALRVYDDVVTRESVSNDDMVRKVTEAYELSDNLGGRLQRKWIIGTRYSFADTYGVILAKGIVKPRIYPATDNGQLTGTPVFLKPEVWEKKKIEQSSQIAAQMLQNPLAGLDQVFKATWFRPYVARPKTLNAYILGDPSKGTGPRSDRTGIAVIGLDAQGNKYLLDGFRHRMSMSERWDALKLLYTKWTRALGVQTVQVGWERYGMQTDLEYFNERMDRDGFSFHIRELSWTRDGTKSKRDRVERLEPDFRLSRFYLPAQVLSDYGGTARWKIDEAKNNVIFAVPPDTPNDVRKLEESGEAYRVIKPIVRKNEDGQQYDVTRALMEEMTFFPFGTHDDLVDTCSRIYDMEARPPSIHELPSALAKLEEYHPDA